MDRETYAVDTFRSGFNCAQAVLTAFSEEFGLDKETALRLACGFGAGMERKVRLLELEGIDMSALTIPTKGTAL